MEFITVTEAVAAEATSVALIAAVSWVELTYVVVRFDPFHGTVLPVTKPVPVNVRVKAVEPAVVDAGAIVLMAGAGLLMANVAGADVPPPGDGFTTATGTVPAEATSAALIAAVSWVELTYVVVWFDPFHCTVLPVTKPVPVNVRVKAVEPAVVELGASAVTEGTGLLTVNVVGVDGPPPGEEFTTATGTVPTEATSAAVIAAVSWVELT